MKKKIILLSLCLILVSGCGTKVPKLENGQEAVVTFKDESKISVDELYEEVKDNYALSSLINLIDKKVHEEKYKDDLDEAKEYAENQIAQLKASYGDDLESVIQRETGLATIEAYQDVVYLSFLQEKAITDYAKSQIKDKEIEKYYEDETVGDIKVNHILITADVTDDMDDEEKEAAEKKAKEEIQEIIDTLKKTDKEDLESKFTELAKEKSEDETTKDSGGSLGYINKGTLGTSYAEIEEAAYKLKDGEFSTDVITTELGYHVIIRLDSKEKPELDEVRDSIIETLADDYLSENSTAAAEALQKVRQDYGVEIQDSELKRQYANYMQSLLSPQENS